ncbi:MAG: bifunctional phosphopantothenoylcysteine decarboxylase/phosphopantothenate synthase, partial [Deltaproteobacteria bacterium CG_4_9_14_3_um_filter_63_12]
MKVLGSRKILLLVGGGIAAYKAPLLVRELIANGAEVRCVLTANAAQFVAPLALQTVSNHAVASDLFDPQREEQINHIELARWPDAILVAPATANLLARAAAGMANDLATTLLLATAAPIVLAPA